MNDLKFAFRQLLKNPGFTSVTVLTLALGIGANTAIFSAVNEVFLRTVPGIQGPERLVVLGRSVGEKSFDGFSYLGYLKYVNQAQSFSGMLAHRGATVLLQEGGDALVLRGSLVTSNYFSVLGVRMALGRDFLREENRTPGSHPVVILSADLWRKRFNAEPTIVGKSIRINDAQFTVVGIAPESFRGIELGEPLDVWLPLMMEGATRPRFAVLNDDFFTLLNVIGRLKPGISRQQGAVELEVLSSRIEEVESKTHQQWRAVLGPDIRFSNPDFRSGARQILTLLMCVVALVLLLVCANVANLLLARAAARRKEIAMRLALGASPARIVRQLLSESVVLAVLGAIAGLLFSIWVTEILRLYIGKDFEPNLDARVLGFTSLVAIASGVIFGLVPALQASRRNFIYDLKDGAGVGVISRSWLRDFLVVSQISISLMLLTGAGLFIRTLQKAHAVNFGFETKNLYLASPDLRLAGYSEERALNLYERLADRLATVPGVKSVSRAFMWSGRQIIRDGAEPAGNGTGFTAEYNQIAPRYFETLGVSVERGRDFTEGDNIKAPLVAIVNETMARQFWPREEAIGQRLRFIEFMGLGPVREIVGVVHDSRTFLLEEKPSPQIFVPLGQNFQLNTTFHIRTTGESVRIAAILRGEIRQFDEGLPPVEVRSFRETMSDSLFDQRIYAHMTTLFGGLALLLAALGLYSVLANIVSRRTREFGIRMALGANRTDVLAMVIRQGMSVTAVGIAIGIVGSLALTRLISAQLFGVRTTDPATYISTLLILLSVALMACWLPARRAARVDPMEALRHE